MDPTQTVNAGAAASPRDIAEQLAARRLAEARIRRMVAENLMLDWSRDLLRDHGPRVVTQTPGAEG